MENPLLYPADPTSALSGRCASVASIRTPDTIGESRVAAKRAGIGISKIPRIAASIGRVATAGRSLKSIAIQNGYFPSGIGNNATTLQAGGSLRNAHTSNAQHQRDQLLGHVERIAMCPVLRH